MSETIQWNGVFGDGCNLDVDCVHCDIDECGGRQSEMPVLAANSPAVKRYLNRYIKDVIFPPDFTPETIEEYRAYLDAVDCLFTGDLALAAVRTKEAA